MPIRINLLAEEQGLEELRRRDPVKRVILGGIVLAALVLAWSVLLLGQTMVRKSELTNLDSQQKSSASSYGQIIQNKKNLDEGRLKMAKLQELSTNRFLVGSLMNALQNTTVENVQLVRLKVAQAYFQTEEIKAKTTDSGERVTPKPATATEKIVLILNAKDSSPVAGNAVKEFQDAISASPYFKALLGKTSEFRLTQRGLPQTDPEGKTFILFTLEAELPERKR